MKVYVPGESIERYYDVMGFKTIDDQIQSEVAKYVKLCRSAAKHNCNESEYKEMAHTVFYHIQELRSTRTPSPLRWF
jgi:hypothetical protein